MKSKAPKETSWRTIAAEAWAKGRAHVAGLTGVTTAAARAAHRRLAAGRSAGRRGLLVPAGLDAEGRPGDAAWLAAWSFRLHGRKAAYSNSLSKVSDRV